MIRRSSLKWAITLGVVLLSLLVVLLVLWIIGQAQSEHWALLTVGTIFFSLVLVGVVIYLVLAIKQARLTQRQQNFIDSVTHELKSPIASIKLCLQTLDMREMSHEQQHEFHRLMLEDVQRLDSLIDHLLEAARLDHVQNQEPIEEVILEPLLRNCVETARRRYQLDEDQIHITIQPCLVEGRPRDLEMVFTNLLDNAAKYAGNPPRIEVNVLDRGKGRIAVRVSDNGKGIAYELRNKIFKRFVRGGSELERTTQGTGLGLYLVKSLVGTMKGQIQLLGRGLLRGATFEVSFPGRPLQDPPAPRDELIGSTASHEEENFDR